MNKILFFLIMPFYFVSASAVSEPTSTLENIKMFVNMYEELPEEEKRDFLSREGVSVEEFQHLRFWSQLNWKTEGSHQLPQSNSTISLPVGYALLTGSDAVAVYTEDGEAPDEHLEAYVCDTYDFQNIVLFENVKTGYISIEDWKELNPKELLDGIVQNTEDENKERRKRGSPELNVIGWIQEPTLDQNTNTVYWAIEATSGDENFVNSVALRLGREGYERITWITSRSLYVPFGGHLDTMLRAYSFDPGYQYNDYRIGDKLAEYGIASLVAATVGGKALKAGGILILLKKFWGLLFGGIAAIFYKLKNLFRRKKDVLAHE